MTILLKDKFWRNVDKLNIDECWNWSGHLRGKGYGHISHRLKNLYAHRVSWELHNGDIPDGMLVLHKCDNRACVNPNHLYLGTQGDNMCDRSERNRYPLTTGRQFKLKPNEEWLVKKIYASGRFTQEFISKMFKVSQPTISYIVNNLAVKENI